MSRRGATDLSGILLVDKPSGMTSHDVVAAVRRATGERRVGHAGTLDPLASGLLVVMVGPATRLSPYLTSATKTYEADIVFGSETSTDDAEGQVTCTAPVPAGLAEEPVARAHVAGLVGTREQVPPAYSAIKVDGRTSYDLARRGEDVELAARPITVEHAELLACTPGPPLVWSIVIHVSKGTYVRAVARDLGADLGTAAHLGALRRTAVGVITIADALPLAKIAQGEVDVATSFFPARLALDLPALELDDMGMSRVSDGRPLDLSLVDRPAEVPVNGAHGEMFVLTHDGRLVAVYRLVDGALLPVIVIPGGAS